MPEEGANRERHEIIDSKELAKRWSLHHSWIRYNVSKAAADPIPHLKLGKYVRFEWGSEPLQQWWNARRKHYSPPDPAQRRETPAASERYLADVEYGRRLARDPSAKRHRPR